MQIDMEGLSECLEGNVEHTVDGPLERRSVQHQAVGPNVGHMTIF